MGSRAPIKDSGFGLWDMAVVGRGMSSRVQGDMRRMMVCSNGEEVGGGKFVDGCVSLRRVECIAGMSQLWRWGIGGVVCTGRRRTGS